MSNTLSDRRQTVLASLRASRAAFAGSGRATPAAMAERYIQTLLDGRTDAERLDIVAGFASQLAMFAKRIPAGAE